MGTKITKWVLCGLLTLSLSVTAGALQIEYFDHWPEGVSPQEVGRRLADRFVASPHQYSPTHYSEICTWYGALEFARLTKNRALQDRLVTRFGSFLPGGAESNLIPKIKHVDNSVFGTVPLQIAILTGERTYLDFGLAFADRQWDVPRPDGLSPETRFWIDDMYMITILQLEAFRATGDRKYLDRSASEMVAYLDKLQEPNGLFHHAVDVPFFWGRGDGWVAAGMAEMLRELPVDHPQRMRILKGYRSMMAALLQCQGKDGMWRQLLDREEAWPESSSSAMFTFAMISGVKNGWLDAAVYGPAARKAWISVVGYIDQNSNVVNVCAGTNKLASYDYYLGRPRLTGDFHGQAPVLWAADAMLRP